MFWILSFFRLCMFRLQLQLYYVFGISLARYAPYTAP